MPADNTIVFANGRLGAHASSQPFRLEVMLRQELENVWAGTSLIRVTISCEAILLSSYRMKGAGSSAWDQREQSPLNLSRRAGCCGMKDDLVYWGLQTPVG